VLGGHLGRSGVQPRNLTGHPSILIHIHVYEYGYSSANASPIPYLHRWVSNMACDQGYLYIKISIFNFFQFVLFFFIRPLSSQTMGPLVALLHHQKKPSTSQCSSLLVHNFQMIKAKVVGFKKYFHYWKLIKNYKNIFFMIMFFWKLMSHRASRIITLGPRAQGPP
jgi:hypothetical protein